MALYPQHQIKRAWLSFFILALALNTPFSYATNQAIMTGDCHPPVDLNRLQLAP